MREFLSLALLKSRISNTLVQGLCLINPLDAQKSYYGLFHLRTHLYL